MRGPAGGWEFEFGDQQVVGNLSSGTQQMIRSMSSGTSSWLGI